MLASPLSNLCHWGPLSALFIISVISFSTIYCNNLLWPRTHSIPWMLQSWLFPLLSAGTIYNFLGSVYNGPGFLPIGWRPESEHNEQYLQWCAACKGYKAPRSHHCKKCGRCVIKMDHHCPWINSCVGHRNHSNFTLFLFFAVCGCSQAAFVLVTAIYYALYKSYYYRMGQEPIVLLGFSFFVLCVFATGLAVAVIIAVGMLLFFQMRGIIRNRTTIEDWIMLKANYRRELAKQHGDEIEPFTYPYNLGTWKNITQVLNSSMTPAGNGTLWPVAAGCSQYDLTEEQKGQKADKRQRSRPYICVTSYSGYKLPIVHGFRVFCSPPCTDEARMPIKPGDSLIITRSTKNWLFGGIIGKNENGDNVLLGKGWFPRCCAVPVEGNDKKTS